MEAAVAAATVAEVAKEAHLVVITKAATAEVAVTEAVAEEATIRVDMVAVVEAATEVVDMVVAAEAATVVVEILRRENSRRHGVVMVAAEATVAVVATEVAIVVAEDMEEETKIAEVVEEGTLILKEVEIPAVPSILRTIMKVTRMEVALAMEVEEVVETNLTEMQTLREHLESSNSILAARERCRSKTLRALSSSISVSTLRRTKVYFRPKKVSQSLLNAGRG
jgi:hypothetical protein